MAGILGAGEDLVAGKVATRYIYGYVLISVAIFRPDSIEKKNRLLRLAKKCLIGYRYILHRRILLFLRSYQK